MSIILSVDTLMIASLILLAVLVVGHILILRAEDRRLDNFFRSLFPDQEDHYAS